MDKKTFLWMFIPHVLALACIFAYEKTKFEPLFFLFFVYVLFCGGVGYAGCSMPKTKTFNNHGYFYEYLDRALDLAIISSLIYFNYMALGLFYCLLPIATIKHKAPFKKKEG